MTTDSLLSLTAALKHLGVRLTRQRRAIVDVLDSASQHLTARDLLDLARKQDPAIDRATVYRTLALLKQNGLIDELDLLHLEGEEHYYERRQRSDHVHIGCPGCGRIVEMASPLVGDLAAGVTRETGFTVTAIRIEVRALCPDCRKQ